jgi:hypothetical protein
MSGTQKTVSSLAGEQIAKDYGLTGRPAYVAQYIADEVRRQDGRRRYRGRAQRLRALRRG